MNRNISKPQLFCLQSLFTDFEMIFSELCTLSDGFNKKYDVVQEKCRQNNNTEEGNVLRMKEGIKKKPYIRRKLERKTKEKISKRNIKAERVEKALVQRESKYQDKCLN